jgi:hypothetical protein
MPRREVDLGNTPFITVVSGLPRSGTSMMMQMLSAGAMPVLADEHRPADDDNPRGYFELDAARRLRQDHAWVGRAVGKAVKVVHLLLPELPAGFHYRVILMERDLSEVIQSQRAMLRRHDRGGADLSPEALARVFTSQLHRVREWLGRQPHVSLLEVRYRDVVDQPVAEAARVNAFLGGMMDVATMSAAVDRELYRHRSGN